MSERNDFTESKKVDESSAYTDSGIQSEFQDSCEISSSEVVTSADKNIDMPRGNSQDKEYDDSGVISGSFISATDSQVVINVTPYVPDCYLSNLRPPQHNPLIDKYYEQDEDGFTKLHIAILHHIEPAINSLISYAPDPSYLDRKTVYGQTALHLAVILGQHMTVTRLINAGANVNVRDNRCNTALHLACINEDAKCVQSILSAVYPQKELKLLANLEEWNYEGETSFFVACRLQNMPIIRALAVNGANVNAREGRSGYTALHMAVENKADDVIKFLCEECNTLSVDTENYRGLTAFQLSLLTEQEPTANYLMSKGATPYYTEDSDIEDDEDDSSNSSSSDYSGDELEQNQIISKIAEIAVN